MLMTEELFDVLDEAGNKTGQVLSKAEVHEKGLWHGSVFIWISNSKGEILLQFRSADKKVFPSDWDVSVAGHISAGEELLDAVLREIKEEINVTITKNQVRQIGQYKDIVPFLDGGQHPEHCWVFLLKLDRDLKQLTPKMDELTELKWMPIAQLKSDLADPQQAKQYAARNRYVYDIGIAEIEKALEADHES